MLPFDDGRFPLVLAIGVLPWVADWRRALAELARITAPGGALIATIDNRFRLNHLLDPARNPMLAGPRAALRRVFGRADDDRPEAVSGTYLRPSELGAAAAAHGLRGVAWDAVGFGPFTFLRRPVFGDADGRRLHRRLQAGADDGVAILRATATQFIFLARRA
jgi:SAM-dependent methyltransferase